MTVCYELTLKLAMESLKDFVHSLSFTLSNRIALILIRLYNCYFADLDLDNDINKIEFVHRM